MSNTPLIMTDGYKTGHHLMYPENTTLVFSNFTPRSTKYMPEEAKEIVVFGIQYTFQRIKDLFDAHFFVTDIREYLKVSYNSLSVLGEASYKQALQQVKNDVLIPLKEELSSYTGSNYDISHFEALWDLGYLPIEVRAMEEGTVLDNPNIPILTYHNTLPEFFWVTNFLETLVSAELWKPMHSASISRGARKLVNQYALETDKDNIGFTDFQNHDFSFRGMQSLESATSSGLGFITSSLGTDTLPVLHAADYYYDTKDAAYSVFATEHAVATSYGKETEINGFNRLLDLFPSGILSLVSDSYDFFKVHTDTIYSLKEKILARDGKTVFRGDSGNPVDIICGTDTNYKDISLYFPTGEVLPEYFEEYLLDEVGEETPHGEQGPSEYTQTYIVRGELYEATIHNISWNRYDKQYYFIDMFETADITIKKLDRTPEMKGQIELLWECFGGTINSQGYKVLNPKVGAIYGDGINFERAKQILEKLKAKRFASTNIVFGWGSYSMGYATRDSQGCAVKATYIERTYDDGLVVPVNIFKEPKTDMGKASAKGLLAVTKDGLITEATWEQVQSEDNLLKTVFKNGEFVKRTTLTDIRKRLQ